MGAFPGPPLAARRIRVQNMNPLVPLFILISLPLAAIGLVLYTDEGINPDLFYASVKTFVILGAIAAAMSFGAMKLSERSKN